MQLFGIIQTLALTLFSPTDGTDDPELSFQRDVRPILSDACYSCHGPDAAKRQAGLRLDSRDGVLAPNRSGRPALIPGNAESSLLIERVSSHDVGMRMPPAKSGKTLSEAQIETLRQWIRTGATWDEHWAFSPIKNPALPKHQDVAWGENGVDAFVLSGMLKQGLEPSLRASKEQLIRRVSLGLTGFVPPPDAVEAFLLDTKPGSYTRLLGTYLESPRYGEHMARLWMDAARYGDTHGLHLDNLRSLWPWRDWVIRAFNDNKPFDDFTVEQLAGDLLPNATRDQKVATGFNRCHPTTGEGGLIVEEYLVKYAVDRVETTSTVWLGLTMSCAQCHDHKFDPITQEDFYRFFAFFNNVDESGNDQNELNPPPTISVPSDEQEDRLAHLVEEERRLFERQNAPNESLDAAQAHWEEDARSTLYETWALWTPIEARSEHGTNLKIGDDASITASGYSPTQDTFEITFPLPQKPVAAIRLDILTDDSLVQGGPGRASNGNFVLTDLSVDIVDEHGMVRSVPLAAANADFSQVDFGVQNAIDEDPKSGWAVFPSHENRMAFFTFAAEQCGPGSLVIRLKHDSVFEKHCIGRFRVWGTCHGTEKYDAALSTILIKETNQRTGDDVNRLREHYRALASPEWTEVNDQFKAVLEERMQLESQIPKTMVMAEREIRRPTHVLLRGQYDQKGKEVDPGVPAFLNPLPKDISVDRLALARWMVDPGNPLTARVMVNRIWQQHFGIGLVSTPENFGSQANYPTHPLLLDWLASQFILSGWDVKALHRLILTSATYRQSSKSPPSSLTRDPMNRWLSRGPRFRLDAEVIRDNALLSSGLLKETLGGPSVKPTQPSGLWREVGYPTSNTSKFLADTGDSQYRRSLYTFWKRTSPPPNMTAFDAPSRESCIVNRSRTNTPMQALVLLNDEQFVEAARYLARRLLENEVHTREERIAEGFRWLTSNRPDKASLDSLKRLLKESLAYYRGHPEEANLLIQVGQWPAENNMDPVELAAWTIVTGALLNLDATVTTY